MLNWLIYNSVLPLLPIPLVYGGAWLVDTPKRWMSIIRDGQLCFYCTLLAATAINDTIKSGDIHANPTAVLAISGMILCMILSTFTYGVAAVGANGDRTNDFKLGISSVATAVVTTLLVILSRRALGILR